MKILLVGENYNGTALESIYNNLIKLNIDTEVLNTHELFRASFTNRVLNKFLKVPYYYGRGVKNINKIVLKKASGKDFDFVFFVKPIFIYPGTISEIKKHAKVVGFYLDHIDFPKSGSNYFYKSLSLFDLYFMSMLTVKEAAEATDKFGSKIISLPFHNADSACCYPIIAADDKEKLGADIVFLGTHANERRMEYSERLCRDGYDIKIYGNGWNWHKLPWNSCLRRQKRIIPGNKPCEEMAKIINSSKIILAFMRDHNNEVTAWRTYEIPLCGGFMLHQRTKEAEQLLAPDKEAVFFGSYDEMRDKIDFYLQHSELRDKIAKAGRERILNCGALNINQVKKMVEILKNEFGG
ncbi:MAG: glycosyltransferase [Patescibacteria group bacterium]